MKEVVKCLNEAYDMLSKIDSGHVYFGNDGFTYDFDDNLVKILKSHIKEYYEERVEQYKKLLKELL